ncbi:MAG: hypothetical protein AAFY06_00025 [Pseudomonadota bacterium]
MADALERFDSAVWGGNRHVDWFEIAADLAAALRPPERRERRLSALSYLKAAGGIEDLDGSLVRMGLHKMRPGLVNNKSGLSLDECRRLLVDAGYLDDTPWLDGPVETTPGEVLDIIREEVSGRPLYPLR